MTIYIDAEYKCHVESDGTMREFDVAFFDGKCPEFIEGYRYIPAGETWTREDGTECSGTSPWKDDVALWNAQREHEIAQLKAMLTALTQGTS